MGKKGRPLRPPPTPPKLERSTQTIPTRRSIFIACEGLTEEAWWLWYARQHRATGVEVSVVGQLGDPRKVVERAIEQRKRFAQRAHRDQDSYADAFECWAVVDVDEHARLPEAVSLAQAHQIPMAISNPCFEIWGLLHLTDQSAWIHRHDCQRRLHEEMPSYHHDRNPILDAEQMRGKEPAARARIAQLDRRHRAAGRPAGNPSTSVHLLCDSLRG